MNDPFDDLMQQVGQLIGLSLRPSSKSAYAIAMGELTVQLQLDPSQEFLWFGSHLAELPPGPFRENVLRDALKANAMADPMTGTLSYYPPKNHLFFSYQIPFRVVTPPRAASLLSRFIEIAQKWQQAVKRGRSSP